MPDFSPSEHLFFNFFSALYFMATPHLLPKTAEQNSAGKQKKANADFSGAKTRGAHFSAGSIFVPGLTGLQPHVLLLYRVPCLPASAGRYHHGIILYIANLSLPTVSAFHFYTSRRGQFVNQSPNAFLQLRFFKCKNARYTFFSIQQNPTDRNLCLRLDRPAASRLTSLQSPTPHGRHLTHLQPPPPTPSSQPFSSLFFIANLLPASTLLSFFHFQSSLPTSSRSLSPRHSLFTSSVLLPPPQPADQTRNYVSRACAACKAAEVAGRRPAFFLFSFFFFLFLTPSPLPGAAASPRRLLFSFSFCFSLFFIRDAFSFLFIFSYFFVLLFLFIFVFLFSFNFSFFLSLFFFFLLLLFYLSCLQSISCSPFLPVLFFFFTLLTSTSLLFTANIRPPFLFFLFSFLFLFPFHIPHPVQPAFRQSLFFFLFFFLPPPPPSPPIFSSSPPAAAKRRKKIGKRTFGEKVTSREKTGSGRKGRGAEGAPGWRRWKA